MPVYEYRCERGHSFEITQRMADDTLTDCIDCGAPVNRVFHPIAVHFKGSGFYNTDYGRAKSDRNQNGGDPAGGDSSSSSKGEEGVGKATTKDGGEKAKQGSGSSSGSSGEGSGSSSSGSGSSGSPEGTKPKSSAA